MFISLTTAILAAAGIATAGPIAKRAGVNDGVILNYALTLEHLEDTFYRDGLAKFSEADFAAAGFDSTFYGNVKRVASDEAEHVSFLTSALKAAGVTPVAECKYEFGYKDVKTFLATASVLEGVGVSAYLGAAADIMSKTYLTAAGSILTVEARHSSYIRAGLKEAPFAQPFDAPLSINEVYSLASQFIVSCPSSNPALPVKAFPKLALDPKTTMPVTTGATVTLQTPGYTLKAPQGSTQVYAAFIAVTGPTFVPATPVNGGFSVQIPKGFAGQTYVVLTGCNKSVTDDTVAAGPAIIESSPFSIRLLEHKDEQGADASRCETNWLQSLLPASHRTESDDLAAPARHVQTCIEKELDLRRLASIHGWLWLAGRPMPPRPLHHQLLVGREIFITEQMDMHLVWMAGRIFLKPMPRFLLEPQFWHEHLSCGQECDCSDGDVGFDGTAHACVQTRLAQRALGFLFSYAALISHESDFLVARENRLLPTEVQWRSWRVLVEELHTEHIYPNIDSPFYYGELRLSRLNKIYYLWWTPLHGYKPRWDQYGVFFRDNFAWLAGTTVYVAVVLATTPVGLATKSLASNNAFQSASYGFTIFSILGPLVAAGLIMMAFCCTFVNNWVVTFRYRKRRLQNISNHPR